MSMTFGLDPQVAMSSPRNVNLSMPGKTTKTLSGTSGSGSGDVQSQMNQQQTQSGQSSTYFADPALSQSIAQNAGGLSNTAAQNYLNVVNNPAGSQAYQNSLVGALAALHPSEMGARRNLADQFRAAGNLASSSYAKGAAGLESGLMRNRMELASDLMAKLYPAITQASFAPISQASNLMNAEKLQQQSNTGQGTSTSTTWFDPLRGELGGGGGGGGGGSVQFFNQGAQFGDLFGNNSVQIPNSATYRISGGMWPGPTGG